MTQTKFIGATRPTFLCASPKIIVLTGNSSPKELTRSETFEPKRATPAVG